MKSHFWALAAPLGIFLLAVSVGTVMWDALGSGSLWPHPRQMSLDARASAGQARPTARWQPGTEITVSIDATSAPSGADRFVERALRTWTEAADGRLRLQRGTIGEASIRVRFIPPGAVYGETLPRADPRTGLLVRAEVGIAVPGDGDTLERDIIIYLTALHELGHALGLAHTDEFTDIMYRFRRPDDGERYFGAYRARLASAADIGSSSASGLSHHDVETFRALYDR